MKDPLEELRRVYSMIGGAEATILEMERNRPLNPPVFVSHLTPYKINEPDLIRLHGMGVIW